MVKYIFTRMQNALCGTLCWWAKQKLLSDLLLWAPNHAARQVAQQLPALTSYVMAHNTSLMALTQERDRFRNARSSSTESNLMQRNKCRVRWCKGKKYVQWWVSLLACLINHTEATHLLTRPLIQAFYMNQKVLPYQLYLLEA